MHTVNADVPFFSIKAWKPVLVVAQNNIMNLKMSIICLLSAHGRSTTGTLRLSAAFRNIYSPEAPWEAIEGWHLSPRIWIPSLRERENQKRDKRHFTPRLYSITLPYLLNSSFSICAAGSNLGETVLEHVIWGTNGKRFKASAHRTKAPKRWPL